MPDIRSRKWQKASFKRAQVKAESQTLAILTTSLQYPRLHHQRLLDTNSKLSEANKIKEEYIGYFFNADSESFEKIEKFKKALEQKIAYRKWDDIITPVKGANLKKELVPNEEFEQRIMEIKSA